MSWQPDEEGWGCVPACAGIPAPAGPTTRGALLQLRVRPLSGGTGGGGRGTESAATLGRPWAAGEAGPGAHASDPRLAFVSRTPRSLNGVSTPSARGAGAVPGGGRARGGRCPGEAALAPRPRRLGEPPASRALGRRDGTGGARSGAGAGLRARPARAACAALRTPAVRPHRQSPAEPSHRARETGAGTERRAAGGSRGVGSGGGSPAAGVPEPGAASRPILPREDATSARGDCGTGRAVPGVGRKRCPGGAAGGGAAGGGWSGGGLRRGEPHSPPARQRLGGARELRGVHAWVWVRFGIQAARRACRAGWAAGGAAQAPSQPCRSEAPAAHADAALAIYRPSLRRPRPEAMSGEDQEARAVAEDSSPSPGDTLPWNLEKTQRSRRGRGGPGGNGSVLDPAERAVIRIAGRSGSILGGAAAAAAAGAGGAPPGGQVRSLGPAGRGRGGGRRDERGRAPEPRSLRAPPAPPAARMAAPRPPGPPPDEQDFIQAYEEVREKYKGTAPPPRPAALTGPPAGQAGLRHRVRAGRPRAAQPRSPAAPQPRRRPRSTPAAAGAGGRGRALRGARSPWLPVRALPPRAAQGERSCWDLAWSLGSRSPPQTSPRQAGRIRGPRARLCQAVPLSQLSWAPGWWVCGMLLVGTVADPSVSVTGSPGLGRRAQVTGASGARPPHLQGGRARLWRLAQPGRAQPDRPRAGKQLPTGPELSWSFPGRTCS
ncbi:collagen alpha-2(I) chain-like [Hippopotamus amphibius kiboko]|uniref:collagen alpha-2(I) chain-like n=1 Tax=Hippopotamus amphibius kiboko TaxID=575201 RepID=UPI002594D6DE|nr:collagen alpha-2(I) chain-like [Hippopotamus amphibius kiboko]